MRTKQAKLVPLSRRRFLSHTVVGAATIAGTATLGASNAVLAAAAASQPLPQAYGHLSVLGHDISTLQQLESVGKTFSDSGQTLPLERILANHGTTYIRQRLWLNPPAPYNDLSHILTIAKRVKAAGLKFLLDFHYSDFWADPGTQTTPSSWQGQSLSTLATTVQNYTRDVISRLVAQGTPPDMVQTGNEITGGMLWPQGKIYVSGSENWSQFATLLKAAIAGVRATSSARVMVHIDRGGDNGGSRYFYDHILAQGVSFDVIGLSYYPWWHGSLSALQANLNDLATRYNKDLVIVETAYPWTLANGDSEANIVSTQSQLVSGYPATPAGQLAYIRKLLSIINLVPNLRGQGIVYWEPAWIPGVGWQPGAGDGWDNLTLFDNTGHSLSSIVCYQ
jgi:arabinogalactan endo-1,4-beta-galactosidase